MISMARWEKIYTKDAEKMRFLSKMADREVFLI